MSSMDDFVIMTHENIPNVVMHDDGSYDVNFTLRWSPKNVITIIGTINKGYGMKIWRSKRKKPEFVKVDNE